MTLRKNGCKLIWLNVKDSAQPRRWKWKYAGYFLVWPPIVRELSRDLFLSISLFLEAGRLFRERRLSNFERQLNKGEGNAAGRKLRGNCCTETVESTPGKKHRSARWPGITTWIIYKVRVTRFRITQRDVSRVHGPRHFRTKRPRYDILEDTKGGGETARENANSPRRNWSW